MDLLESQLKEARFLAEEADKKYDEVIRVLSRVVCYPSKIPRPIETSQKTFEITRSNFCDRDSFTHFEQPILFFTRS